LVAGAVAFGSVTAPAWASETLAAPVAVGGSSAVPPVDSATIPAFDVRFPVSGPAAKSVARPGVLTLRASVGLRCAFNGAWSDFTPAAHAKRPTALFNAVASIGCEPVDNASGTGSVQLNLGAKLVGSKNLSWKVATHARPELPVVKLPTNSSPAALAALQAQIARTPGGVPIAAAPAGRAACRMISAWRGYPTDAFPRIPRVGYRSAAGGWVALACTPASNAAGSATVKAPGGASRTISWGTFSPYTLPPAAPIPAFDLAFPNAPQDAVGKLSLAVTPRGATAPGAMACSITSTTSTLQDPTTLLAGVACLPSSWHGGSITVTLRYGDTPVATVDKTWADVNSARRPRLPAIKLPLVGWPDISALTAAAPSRGANASAAVAADPNAAKIAEARAYLARARQVLDRLTVELQHARKDRDVVKTLCVDDKLSQASTSNRALMERVEVLQNTLDGARFNHEWSIAGFLLDRIQVLETEMASCVGDVADYSGGGQLKLAIDGSLPNGSDLPDVESLPITLPPYTGRPLAARPDSLGSPSWWRPTVPKIWAKPDADPVRWTPGTTVPVRVNCPALDAQGCEDELTRIQAAAQEIKSAGGPDLKVQPAPSGSRFAPQNPAPGKGHGDPSFPVTFTKPGEIKKNPDGSWARVNGRVQLLPGELEKGLTDIFYDRTVLATGGKPNEAGVGGFDWASDGQGVKITNGYVAIDASTVARVDGWKLQALYMHELGHAIGLHHPDQPRSLPGGLTQPALPSTGQIMDSTIDVPDARWGNGDLAGLAAVGRAEAR
jgi:hypothetical protein